MNFNLNDIKEKLQNKIPTPIDVKHKFSVLIPLIERDGELHLLYEKRSFNLRNQPGEISFPGGRIEKGEDPKTAAIRETSEELLMKYDEIEIISEGDFLVNPYSAIIYSFVGVLKKNFYDIEPSEDEVDRVFTVPLKYLLNHEPDSYTIKLSVERNNNFPYHKIPNGVNYKFKRGSEEVLFYEYNDEVIWGFTAKMTKKFIESLKESKM